MQVGPAKTHADPAAPLLSDLLQDLDSSPASASYLEHLLSLSLDDLLHEPHLIANETSTVEAELTNLCYREYTTFTLAQRSSVSVNSALDDFASRLHSLVEAVPTLEDECRAFTKSTASVQAARNRVTLVQEHQNKLAELLELPQLMETCVRNGFYQEAMELGQHTQLLLDRYPNALVKDVASEVDGVLQVMMTQLLALLREPIKLPALVKALGFLRRLGHENLGLAFLQSRLYNYRVQVAQIEKDRPDPVRYIRRYIDLFREYVYDIISQYSAIFDPSPHLVSFASQCTDELIAIVVTYIPRVQDSASLSSILVQLGYCALSFSRVGMDFAMLTNEHFLRIVEATYARAVSSAATEFTSRISKSTTLPRVQDSISHYPPLALFYNAHLEALNALRLLAPLELRLHTVSAQHASLAAATRALLQYFDHTLVSDAPSAPSSPRSQLLRRNTETQLAPEVRAARRRETKRGCATMAKFWRDEIVPTITAGLEGGVYDGEGGFELAELKAWLDEHDENGLKTPRTSGEMPRVMH